MEELDHRLKELKAQVLYRLEQYEDALYVYEDIVKNADDDYGDERENNLGAVLVYVDKKKVSMLITLNNMTHEISHFIYILKYILLVLISHISRKHCMI